MGFYPRTRICYSRDLLILIFSGLMTFLSTIIYYETNKYKSGVEFRHSSALSRFSPSIIPYSEVIKIKTKTTRIHLTKN